MDQSAPGRPGFQGNPVVADGKVLATYSAYGAGGSFGITGQALDPATGTPVPGWSGGVTALRWPLVATETQVCPEGICGPAQFSVTDAGTGEQPLAGWQPLRSMTIGRLAVYGGRSTFDGTFTATVAARAREGGATEHSGTAGYPGFPSPNRSNSISAATGTAMTSARESRTMRGRHARRDRPG